MPDWIVIALTLLILVLARAAYGLAAKRRNSMTSTATVATYHAPHTASLAARHLRNGLAPPAAERAARDLSCPDPDCAVRGAILAPIVCDDRVVAVLGAYGASVSADLVRATQAVPDRVSTQVELAELDRERASKSVAQH